jgi:hypothetical protein
MTLDGVFSPLKVESPLWDANKIYVKHCSSDYYLGRLGGPDNVDLLWPESVHWRFRGQNAVQAVI